MNRTIALGTLLSVSLGACASAQSAEHVLGIGGIRIEDSVQSVAVKLGEPIERTEHLDFVSLRYVYRDLTIGFEDQSVVELRSRREAACTEQGLCPGDPVSKMLKIYGQLVKTSRETGEFLEYYVDGSFSCWYQFAVSGDRVTAVGVICQP